MKVVVTTFNQEKALVGLFSLISKTSCTFVPGSTGHRTMATQADKYLHEGGSWGGHTWDYTPPHYNIATQLQLSPRHSTLKQRKFCSSRRLTPLKTNNNSPWWQHQGGPWRGPQAEYCLQDRESLSVNCVPHISVHTDSMIFSVALNICIQYIICLANKYYWVLWVL